jgi:hypothetical protein
LLSKVLLVVLLGLLAGKLGLRAKLRELKPRFDRGINWIIVGLVVIYAGQLLWWLIQRRS